VSRAEWSGHRVVPLVESLWSVTRSSLRDGPPTEPQRHARAAATLPHRIPTTPGDLPPRFCIV
jgi:hypothetical protein